MNNYTLEIHGTTDDNGPVSHGRIANERDALATAAVVLRDELPGQLGAFVRINRNGKYLTDMWLVHVGSHSDRRLIIDSGGKGKPNSTRLMKAQQHQTDESRSVNG